MKKKEPPLPRPSGRVIQLGRRGGKTTGSWTKETRPKGMKVGRKPGSKDKIPRSVKKSIIVIVQDLVSHRPELIRKALIAGLKARPPASFPYLQLAAAYNDGRPTERIEVQGQIDLKVSQAGQDLKVKLAQMAASFAEARRREREAQEHAALPWVQPLMEGQAVDPTQVGG